MIDQPDTSNTFFQLAESFVNYTDRHLFLTGRAGTGKTTFLRHIVETTSKLTVVVAPTGVAAINAGGVTMHSFFQLPFIPFLPGNADDPSGRSVSQLSLFQKIRFNENKRKLLQELELLIIDEISMVRADMLDAVDAILRRFRRRYKEPFGGVQVLMIGDLYQLPPVVGHNEDAMLKDHYQSPFFFDAHVLKETPPVCIELQKIYRQKDLQFISLLNRVRNNEVTTTDLEWINKRFNPDFKPSESEKYITLSSHNYIADNINEEELKKLPDKEFKFEAVIEGEFSERAYPADVTLKLKKGAQIMFIKNDKGEFRRYYNGKIGTVKDISEDGILVAFPDEFEDLELESEEWQNIRYKLNEEKKKVEEEVIGVFRQYPVKLAWAITIHKSQGLTFERAIVDAGSSFTAGQVYVALSRLTNVEGLVLRSRIHQSSISCDNDVLRFMDQQQDEKILAKSLAVDQQTYVRKTLLNSFDFTQLLYAITNHLEDYRQTNSPVKHHAIEAASAWLLQIENLKNVADQFTQKELAKILDEDEAGYARLFKRMQDAANYFHSQLKENLFDAIEEHLKSIKEKGKTKKYVKAIHSIQLLILEKKKLLEQSLSLAKGLYEGKNSIDLLRQFGARKVAVEYEIPPELVKKKRLKGETQRTSLAMFKSGKSVLQIAEERGFVPGTIESHLAQFVKTGELSVFELLPKEKVNTILPLVAQAENFSATPVKERLGDACSYSEIRMVRNHWLWTLENDGAGKEKS